MRERVVILGSTGSIGCSTLDVLTGLGDRFDVVGLAAGSRWVELGRQAHDWAPECVAIGDATHVAALRSAVPSGTAVLGGRAGLVELIERCRADCVVAAIVGAAGVDATAAAVRSGCRVALANKEALVVAGPLMTALARQSGATLVPIDSEHSAIFQGLHAGRIDEVERIYLTASGGPFRTWSRERIAAAELADALQHPVWSMGPKITIDSATMMNKALEVIEARWLFDLPPERIGVLVHPEALVHGMVKFHDGSLVAQISKPDMRLPIQYALTWPDRQAGNNGWDPTTMRQLTFEPPDLDRFPAVALGFDAARRGGTAGAALNGANEAAVELFRKGHIKLGEIARVSADILHRHPWDPDPTWDRLHEIDRWARNEVHACLNC